ncbi:MAG: hypothetical protein HDR31_00570 [Mycoplasma sp.]|nr:hypothetical protein [Mycoplasma sp.]
MSDRYRDDYNYAYDRGYDDGYESALRSKRFADEPRRNKDVIYSKKSSKQLSESAKSIIKFFKLIAWLLTSLASIALVAGLIMSFVWFGPANQNPSDETWGWTSYAGLVLVVGSLGGLAAALFHFLEFLAVLFNKKGWFKKKNAPLILGFLSTAVWFCISATILYVSFGMFVNIQVPGFDFAIINEHLPYIGFLRNIILSPENFSTYLGVSIAVVVMAALLGIYCLKSINKVIEERE